jgi:hypothetical protein
VCFGSGTPCKTTRFHITAGGIQGGHAVALVTKWKLSPSVSLQFQDYCGNSPLFDSVSQVVD